MKLVIGDRAKVILKGTLTSVIPRGLGYLYTILIIPLVLKAHGEIALGLWLTVVSVIEILNFADFGITNNLINMVAKTYLEKDVETERKIVSSSFVMIIVIACVICGMYLATKDHVDWAHLLKVDDQHLIGEAKRSLTIVVLYFVINFPLVIFQKIRYAIQERHFLNYYEASGKIVTILLVLLGIYLHFSLSQLILMYVLGPVSGQLINTITLMINKPQFVPSLALFNKGTVKEIFGTSVYFFVINLAYLFYSSFDNILITNAINPSAVAGFATVKRVYDLFPMMVALATPSFWVTNREAFLRRDMRWLNNFFTKGILMNGAALLALVVLSLIVNAHFFKWFTHGSVENMTQLLITVVAVNAVIIINYNFYSAFFIAIDEIKRFTWFFGVFAVLSFGMKVLLLPRIGVTYTYMCNAGLYFVTFFLPCYLYLRKKVVLL
ncbi:hypothetical protein DCC81_18650 [Chitinophaga parva]|uniref:Polysaccharide biosynthesis protein n=1 Tax=Chitinophaga parva TaxID=2169414 RepID=A0A2T7BIZ2_9BACT|nr:oligosaccharide flippase family protein [Chitinophaga parva]PUZ26245.1 hypothetical protein DCC81_18650 [Chitinophaga parva]